MEFDAYMVVCFFVLENNFNAYMLLCFIVSTHTCPAYFEEKIFFAFFC